MNSDIMGFFIVNEFELLLKNGVNFLMRKSSTVLVCF